MLYIPVLRFYCCMVLVSGKRWDIVIVISQSLSMDESNQKFDDPIQVESCLLVDVLGKEMKCHHS
jgi:hypothetical protein